MSGKPFDPPAQPEAAPTIRGTDLSSQITLSPADTAVDPTSPISTSSAQPLLPHTIGGSLRLKTDSGKASSSIDNQPSVDPARDGSGSDLAKHGLGLQRSFGSSAAPSGSIKNVTTITSSSPSSISSADAGVATPAKKPLKSRLWDIWMKNWFLLGLVVAIVLARFYPGWGKTGGPIKPEYSVKYGFTSMIFLLSGLGLKTKDLFISAINYRAHLMVQLTSFIIIPMVVKAVTALVGLSAMNATLLAGMLVTAATPTTISSNVVMTANASGNESLALFNAAFGNLLGVFISPLIVLILLHGTPESPSGQNGLDYPKILRDLGLTILVPILVGQLYLYYFPASVAWMKSKVHFPTLNSLCLLILVWSVFCDAFYSKTFDFVTAGEIVAVAVMQAIIFWVMTFFLGILARWRPRKIRQLKAIAEEQAKVAAEQKQLREQQERYGDVEVQAPPPEESADQPQQPRQRTRIQEFVEPMSKKDTVAILFCGATKSVAMGVPMIKVLYDSESGSQLGGLLATPLLIYHVEQLFSGAFMVPWLKRWVGRGEETVESFEHHESERIDQQ
ncbi:hypothetical protein DFQ27_005103 [Actinomortierella ambigua]|uniref:Uncharacterized protein n=1 Tax=Actinomortierella ambigua TaxID=1343610 RepID=A0A9P6UBA3_9FUNG|nr:hypothetical protein DFQ27_005103 [Actinomortierella ambigua]